MPTRRLPHRLHRKRSTQLVSRALHIGRRHAAAASLHSCVDRIIDAPPMPLVRIVLVLPCLSTKVRVAGRSGSHRNSITVLLATDGRDLATNCAPTSHRRTISRSDQPDHSGSLSSVSTARPLSSWLRRQPCSAFEPTLCSIASPRPPARMSAAIVCSPPISAACQR
jgi:hypothetical protein